MSRKSDVDKIVFKNCDINNGVRWCLAISVSQSVSIHPWLYTFLFDVGRLFSFLIFYAVGRTHLTGDEPVARPLPAHRTAQTQNKPTQTSMHQVVFELMIQVFERAKTVHALDRAATVMGYFVLLL
jgi:hypothetical protein